MKELRDNHMKLVMDVRMKAINVLGFEIAHDMLTTERIIPPFDLIEKAVRSNMITLDEITKDLFNSADEESSSIEDSYADSGEGIGSSDMVCFMKNALDGGGFKTEFIKGMLTRI